MTKQPAAILEHNLIQQLIVLRYTYVKAKNQGLGHRSP